MRSSIVGVVIAWSVTACGGEQSDPIEATEPASDVSLSDAIDGDGIDPPLADTWLPDDTELSCDSGELGDAPDAAAPDAMDVPSELAACEDQLQVAAPWFAESPIGPLSGLIEFGQTHVRAVGDERTGPDLAAERETLLLFTPDASPGAGAEYRVSAWVDGELLGVLRMRAPDRLPASLEQRVSTVPLSPYSTDAWSATLPWSWMRSGVNLRIGQQTEAGLSVLDYELTSLAAPHRFTLTRTHMVLFGEPEYEVVPPHPATKVARDMAPWVPGAELRWVDTSAWRLDRMVVNTVDGPRWAHSEAERQAITSDDTRWNLIKHQGALRLSLANTGRGLRYTLPPEGDSSPFGYGTSMVQGWVRLPDGHYTDINNAGLAAGWTGWSGMWLDECGNGFIHEVGHTFTLQHFTEGTAFGWGIADEYPDDGVWQSDHPVGYDTVRRRFRTWYRVDSQGPVLDDGAFVGKRDPMNGGETSDSGSCYPPYTAYQMKRSLDWLESSPTLLNENGAAGVYRWDRSTGEYAAEAPPADVQTPTDVGVPVLTLIGSLGNVDTVCQTYPPVMSPVGNVFEMPDPLDPELVGFGGAQWFLVVTYADGSEDRALINRTAVAETDTGLYLYSVNVALEREPVEVALYRSETGYPAIDIDGAEMVHSRSLMDPPAPEAPVLRVGHGELANDEIRLTDRCEPGLNCTSRRAESVFPVSDAQLSFHPTVMGSDDVVCAPSGEPEAWMIPVVSDADGTAAEVVVHALRRTETEQAAVEVAAGDRTPWLDAANLRQSLVVWAPWEENQGLPMGTWRTQGQFLIEVRRDGVPWRTVPLRIALTVHATEQVMLPPEYVSAGVAIAQGAPDSSIYYTFDDPTVGPSTPQWWGDDTGNLVVVAVRDLDTGESAVLHLRGHKLACGSMWGINTGQAADWGCTHQVRLVPERGANTSLVSGHTYRTPGSSPVVLRARRWHEPGAGAVLKTLALQVSYTAP